MSQRPGLLVDCRIKASEWPWPATRSPNAQPDVVNAEIRCHWPYLAPRKAVEAALTRAGGEGGVIL